MANKLTSLTGFGEGDPKPEYKRASSKHRSYPLGHETTEARKHRGDPGAEHDLRQNTLAKKFSRASGTFGKKYSDSSAKSKALSKKSGEGEYKNVKFTPKSKKESRMFDKAFRSKTA